MIELLLLTLAMHLRTSPSISENLQNNFLALRTLLTGFNWHDDAINRLIYGDKLSTLFSEIVSEFAVNGSFSLARINQHGGWSSHSQSRALAKNLNSIAGEIFPDNPHLLNIIDTNQNQMTSKSPPLTIEDLIKTYHRTQSMLNSALEQDSDLFLSKLSIGLRNRFLGLSATNPYHCRLICGFD